MTTDVSLIMTPYRLRSFWTGAKMLCEKAGKRDGEMEWRIYYPDDILRLSLTTNTDPSHSFRMTLNIPLIMTPFPPIVILNGGKNTVWEKREMGQWNEVKNLLPGWHLTAFLTTVTDSSLALWMTPYRLPLHDNRSLTFASDDTLTSTYPPPT